MPERLKVTHPLIHEYLEKVRPASDPVLRQMEREAQRRGFPYLGPQCSRILHLLVKVTKARRIFELGSGFGYTMYWMAKALPAGGKIVGTEGDPENVRAATEYFRRGRLSSKAEIRQGDALSILRKERVPFDLIYCDIDKHEYPSALPVVKRNLRSGGLFVTDNLLWDGLVIDSKVRDRDTEGIRAFTRRLYADKGFFTTIIPIRDGMSVSVRL